MRVGSSRGLRQLRLLYLDGSKVTDAGVRKLQQALPNCEIDADMPTTDPSIHRFRLTPGHCLLALLAVEFLLFLSSGFAGSPRASRS